MGDLKSRLSERQIHAAHRLNQDVCVVAGPGSGKTSVLIERFTWLVSKHGVDPGRILAITFTDKAATEIKERMVRAFAHAPEIREQIERAYVSTIHGFCARLLRENAIIAGIDPQFQVLEQPGKLLRQVADEVLETIYTEQPERMRRFLRSLAVIGEGEPMGAGSRRFPDRDLRERCASQARRSRQARLITQSRPIRICDVACRTS